MTDQAMSPLRRRMIEDMTVRNFVTKTQADYIRRVKNFAVFLVRGAKPAAVQPEAHRCLTMLGRYGISGWPGMANRAPR